jgi:hypothetical protein
MKCTRVQCCFRVTSYHAYFVITKHPSSEYDRPVILRTIAAQYDYMSWCWRRDFRWLCDMARFFHPIMQKSNADVPHATTAIAAIATALSVIVACSAPAVWRLALRIFPTQKHRYQAIPGRYQDEDGIATQESEAAYSYQLPRILVLLLSLVCSLNSLICCVITTQRRGSTLRFEQWMQFGAWVCSGLSQRSRIFADLHSRCA